MTLELDIHLKQEGDVMIVSTSGELDDYNAPKLNDIFSDIIENQKIIKLVVNLEETTYVDSVGLGAIAIAAKKTANGNGKLHIVCTRPQIIKLLEASGMVSSIKHNIGLYPTLDLAVSAIQST